MSATDLGGPNDRGRRCLRRKSTNDKVVVGDGRYTAVSLGVNEFLCNLSAISALKSR